MSQAWTQMCHMCIHLEKKLKMVTYPLNLPGFLGLRQLG